MEYIKEGELKVTCIASEDDFSFFGITFDDLLDRTEAGFHFLKKLKELAGQTQKVTWTNIAYTLQIYMLPDGRVSLTFSETIADYIQSLRHSVSIADDMTKSPLETFIETLEQADEETARKLVARFEKNVRNI